MLRSSELGVAGFIETIRHPRVLALPHLSQNTLETQTETSRQVALDVLAALRGDDCRNIANLPFRPGLDYLSARPYLQLAERLGKAQGQLAEGVIGRIVSRFETAWRRR